MSVATPQKLLERAEGDLESAEILYCREKTRYNSLYHLEQALEKTLKAIIIGVLLKPLESTIDAAKKLGIADRHKEIHEFLGRGVMNYVQPARLRHDFKKFTDLVLPKLYEKFCTSDNLLAYFKDVYGGFAPSIEQNKGKFVTYLKRQGFSEQQAEKVYELLSTLPAEVVSFLENNVKKPLCNPLSMDFKSIREQIMKTPAPCLKDVNNLVKDLEKQIRQKFEEEFEKAWKEHYGALGARVEELAKVLKEAGITTAAEDIEGALRNLKDSLLGVIILFLALPLHWCLYRYYGARYGEIEVPAEDIEEIPSLIETIRHLHAVAKKLVSALASQLSA